MKLSLFRGSYSPEEKNATGSLAGFHLMGEKTNGDISPHFSLRFPSISSEAKTARRGKETKLNETSFKGYPA